MKSYIYLRDLLRLSVMSTFFWLASQTASLSLPGQTLEEVQNMVRRSETFPGMSLEYSNWQGNESYIVSNRNGDRGVVLYVYEKNNTVASEMLQYRYPSFSMAFERDNETGLRLIESMWDRSVVEDFVNSRYTDAIENPGFSNPDHFYLGERFGYQVSYYPEHNGNSGIYTLRITTHNEWEAARQSSRFCLNNPNHNDCIGL